MRIDLRRFAPLVLALLLAGAGTAQLASNDVPSSSAGHTQVQQPASAVSAP